MENTLNIKKRVKKGFTLVELLVVIAILAILASVSVVGYLGFTDKANQSKADSELAQAENLLQTLTVDEVTYDPNTTASTATTYTVTLDTTTNTIIIYYGDVSSKTTSGSLELDKVLKGAFEDLSLLDGTFSVDETDKWLIYSVEGQTATSSTLKVEYKTNTSTSSES